ncbi:membrane protein [Alcaligenes pakistanensis]|uniref:Membrane protein n=1 Tax=Alcaligenes pakistanensis TaxID=1482717 RepID=A0A8H9IIJ6_9BURK|nr:ester cyclase [Alcaligenes pakistanensis]MBP6623114.1 ester cyclase [Alcaligenes sp.]GHC45110.1 membrane protein [Alcaligenes pakistanensis]
MKGIIRWVSPVLLAGSFLLGTNVASAADSQARNLVQEESNRKLVVDFYDRFFNKHEVEQAATVVAEDYIQHNPEVPDGKSPFVGYFGGYFKDNPQSRARIVRSATDGDLVYLHVHSTNGKADRGQAVIDIFRVKNGKIVEHWDVIQAVPEQAANSNTMF